MIGDKIEYLQRRLVETRDLAAKAVDPAARLAHERLAHEYAKQLEQLKIDSPS